MKDKNKIIAVKQRSIRAGYCLPSMWVLLLLLINATWCGPATGDDNSSVLLSTVATYVHDHLQYWQKMQVRGGWAEGYRLIDDQGYDGKWNKIVDGVVLQHEATPKVAMLFVLAYELLRDNKYLETAKRTGNLLLELQQDHGGWAENFLWRNDRWQVVRPRNFSGEGILDDGVSQNSTILLLWLYRHTRDERFRQGAQRGLEFFLAAQHNRGSWPQAFPGKRTNLSGSAQAFSVLNDGATAMSAELLLWQSLRDKTFATGREAFFRCVDWLIKVQSNQNVPAWGLQYDRSDKLTWGRPWEPPAISPSASRDAMSLLLTAYEITQDQRYLVSVQNAWHWFAKHEQNGGWVLFYNADDGESIRAANGKLEKGIMNKTGYFAGKPLKWGLPNIKSRLHGMLENRTTAKNTVRPTTQQIQKFLAKIAKVHRPGEPFSRKRLMLSYTFAKDRRPWQLLDIYDYLVNNRVPPKNVLKRVDAMVDFPDVEHSKGR